MNYKKFLKSLIKSGFGNVIIPDINKSANWVYNNWKEYKEWKKKRDKHQ
jgi:hypothetical protein